MENEVIGLEYQALRNEIVTRIELRGQTIIGVATLAGLLYGFGISTPSVAFVYPIVALFLAVGWTQNDISIKLIGTYIRDQIETKELNLHWQTWRTSSAAKSTLVRGYRFTSLSAAGVFLITEAFGLLIGFARYQDFSAFDWIVGGIAFISTVLTAFLLREHANRIKDIRLQAN